MNRNRVVWHEGLFLRPQHLQQQERFLEHWIEGRCRGLRNFGWGLSYLELDDAMLALGKIVILRANGVFPDGTPFDIPGNTPPPRPFEAPADLRNCILYLSLPLVQANASLMAAENENGESSSAFTRYRVSDLTVRDLHTGGMAHSEAEVQVGELNVQLLAENDKRDAFATVPLLRLIERDKDGMIKLDKDFIPAVMHCHASIKLSGYITEIVGLLNHRGDELARRIASPGTSGIAEIAEFLMLQLINRYESMFRHLQTSKDIFPEDFFRILTELSGELATFTRDERRPISLPEYIHENQQLAFDVVMDEIRRALATVLEQRAIPIDITEYKPGIWTAMFKDKSLLNSASFVLAVGSDIPAEVLRNNFPNQSTLASMEQLAKLVNANLPGIKISPLPQSPRQIPHHAGLTYFEINTREELWSQLENSGGLAVHIAMKLEKLRMELWAIRE